MKMERKFLGRKVESTEANLKPSWTSYMKKAFCEQSYQWNSLKKPLIIFAKISVFDVLPGSEYVSGQSLQKV